jgi:integrase
VRGHRVEGTTKSGRSRRVTHDAPTVEDLRAHLERQNKEREVAAGSWHEDGHVFRLEIGRPLAATYPGDLMRDRIRAYNNSHPDDPLPPMRLHDLRHIHATLLLEAGVPVHVVAARLGHADPAITLRVYAHVLRDQASGVAQVFASAVDSERPANPAVSKSVSKNGTGGKGRTKR